MSREANVLLLLLSLFSLLASGLSSSWGLRGGEVGIQSVRPRCKQQQCQCAHDRAFVERFYISPV
eukprot:scaffold2018_cov113-Cylindrotheca_fusiformis.AAC.13